MPNNNAKLDEAVKILKIVEWTNGTSGHCPICDAWEPEGHEEGCELAKLISIDSPTPSAPDKPASFPCGEYKIPGIDGNMWKCGAKPVSANGKILLCKDCEGMIEKWGDSSPDNPAKGCGGTPGKPEQDSFL